LFTFLVDMACMWASGITAISACSALLPAAFLQAL